jgi:hypothetical protein
MNPDIEPDSTTGPKPRSYAAETRAVFRFTRIAPVVSP